MTKLNRVVTYNEQNSPTMSFDPRGHVSSRDKLKALYLLFQNAFDHEPLQGSHLWQGKITFNVTWLSNPLITWGHVTK